MSDVEDRNVVLPSLRAALVAAADEQERQRGVRGSRVRRVLSLATAAAAAAVVIVVLAGVLTPEDAAAGVSVRRDDSEWVVTVRDAAIAATDIEHELEQHGIHASITPVAAAPSQVGKFVLSTDDGAIVGGDGRLISAEIRLPIDAPLVRLKFGRPARGGETYELSADAYAEAEPLECSAVFGRRVAEARPVIESRFAGPVDWRSKNGQPVNDPPADAFVTDAAMISATHMMVWLNDAPESQFLEPPTHGSARCPVAAHS